jgi:hypothetical protein
MKRFREGFWPLWEIGRYFLEQILLNRITIVMLNLFQHPFGPSRWSHIGRATAPSSPLKEAETRGKWALSRRPAQLNEFGVTR